MDSEIKVQRFTVTDEHEEDLITNKQKGAPGVVERPDIETKANLGHVEGYRPETITFEDDMSSHYTPGSMYQISMHKRESQYMDGDDGL
jgi:hypothetical protein